MRKIYGCVLNLLFVATLWLCWQASEKVREQLLRILRAMKAARSQRKISVFVFKRKRQREGNGIQRSTRRYRVREEPPSYSGHLAVHDEELSRLCMCVRVCVLQGLVLA